MLCNAMQIIAMQKVFNTLVSNIQWVVLSFYCDLDRLSWQCGARLIEKIKKWRIVTKKAPIGAKKKRTGESGSQFCVQGPFWDCSPTHEKVAFSWPMDLYRGRLETWVNFSQFSSFKLLSSTFCGWQCSKVDGINFRYIGW